MEKYGYTPDEGRYVNGMKYRRCGKSGIMLPEISLGFWHNFGDVDSFENARAMVHYAFDHGVCHFDLANNYGPSAGSAEKTLGTLMKSSLQPFRDELFISTKAGYDMWLGPAPKRPFNPNRFHFTFRWFWDYAGGLMTDWGVHLLDYALYGMNVTAPQSIMASGGKFGYPDDACETPDLLQTVYTFKDFTVMWDHAIGIDDGAYGRSHGLGFVGENGTLVVDRGGWEVIPERVNGKARMERVELRRSYGEGGLNLHVKNHLECIKARTPEKCNANIHIGAHIAKFAQLGNIAYRTGKKLTWDGKSFPDREADSYLCKEYRKPWKLPKI